MYFWICAFPTYDVTYFQWKNCKTKHFVQKQMRSFSYDAKHVVKIRGTKFVCL